MENKVKITKWSKEQQELILTKLISFDFQINCWICGQRDYSVNEKVTHIKVSQNSPDNEAYLPLILITCTNCGYCFFMDSSYFNIKPWEVDGLDKICEG